MPLQQKVINTPNSAFGFQPKLFRYTLIIRGVKYEVLQNAPDGWLQTKLEYNRSVEMGGLIRALTFPIVFTNRGHDLLKIEYAASGIQADVKLLIEKFNTDINIWDYEPFPLMKLDFSQISIEQYRTTCNAIEDNIMSAIDAFGDTDYSLSLNVPEAVTVNLNPLTLRETALLSLTNRNNPQADTIPGFTVVQNIQNSVTASVQDVNSKFISNPDWGSEDSWFYKATIDNKIKIHLILNIYIRAAASTLSIQLYNQAGVLLRQPYSLTTTGPYEGPIAINETWLINVKKGDKLFLYFDSNKDGQSGGGFIIDSATSGSIELLYDTSSPASQCKGLRLSYVFAQLIKNMNRGLPYPTQSQLLTTTLQNIVLTSSDGIRKTVVGATFEAGNTLQAGGLYQVLGDTVKYNNITYNVNAVFTYVLGQDTFIGPGFVQQIGVTPQLITNWNDFIKSIIGWMGGQAGFSDENKTAIIENLNAFFRFNQPSLSVGNITNAKIEPDTERGANTLKIGYEDQQYNSINAVQEVNSTQTYSSNALLPARELDLTVPYRTDAYGIEETRIQPVDSASSKSDNDVFAIWLKSTQETDGSFTPQNVADADSFSGVDKAYYNWQLSPKHNLMRGGAYLRSVFVNLPGYQLTLTSAQKNAAMVVTYQGVRVAEGEPVVLSSLPAPLFGNSYITFNPLLDANVRPLLALQPYGYVVFNYNGGQFRGFIANIATDEAQNSTQEWKLLLTADSNLVYLLK